MIQQVWLVSLVSIIFTPIRNSFNTKEEPDSSYAVGPTAKTGVQPRSP